MIVFLVIIGVFAVIMAGCFGGAASNSVSNTKLVPAQCKTVSTLIVTASCYNSCISHDSKNNCIGGYYTCYEGYVTAAIDNITAGTSFKVYTNDYWNNVNAFLTVNYPSQRQFGCYYTYSGALVSIQLSLYPVESVWIAGYVMAGIAATALLVWGVWELMVVLCNCNWRQSCCSCCRDCSHSLKLRREAKLARQRDLIRRDLEAQSELSVAANTSKPSLPVNEDVEPSAPPIDNVLTPPPPTAPPPPKDGFEEGVVDFVDFDRPHSAQQNEDLPSNPGDSGEGWCNVQ